MFTIIIDIEYCRIARSRWIANARPSLEGGLRPTCGDVTKSAGPARASRAARAAVTCPITVIDNKSSSKKSKSRSNSNDTNIASPPDSRERPAPHVR